MSITGESSSPSSFSSSSRMNRDEWIIENVDNSSMETSLNFLDGNGSTKQFLLAKGINIYRKEEDFRLTDLP